MLCCCIKGRGSHAAFTLWLRLLYSIYRILLLQALNLNIPLWKLCLTVRTYQSKLRLIPDLTRIMA